MRESRVEVGSVCQSQRPAAGARWRGFIAASLLIAFVPMVTTACFGRFQVTRTLYDFNKRVDDDKWIQWFVFVVLAVTPAYGLAVWVDALFVNSIEFWTGENPVRAHSENTRVVQGPMGEKIEAVRLGGGVFRLTVTTADGEVYNLELRRERAGVAAYDESGRLLARAGEAGGFAPWMESATR